MQIIKKLKLLQQDMKKYMLQKCNNLRKPIKRCLKVKLKQSFKRLRGLKPNPNSALSYRQKSAKHHSLNLSIQHVISRNKKRVEVRQRMELGRQHLSFRSTLSNLHLSINASSTSAYGSCLIRTKMFTSLKKVTCVYPVMRTRCLMITQTTISSTSQTTQFKRTVPITEPMKMVIN